MRGALTAPLQRVVRVNVCTPLPVRPKYSKRKGAGGGKRGCVRRGLVLGGGGRLVIVIIGLSEFTRGLSPPLRMYLYVGRACSCTLVFTPRIPVRPYT